MRRRDLLRGALGLGALAALSPVGLSEAQASGSPQQQRAALSNAFRAAVLAERPLLVIVIPEEEPWERGQAIGNWLNNASYTDLAPLGQVEVVCANLADLRRLVPQIGGEADPWFVLVAPDGAASGIALTLPELPSEDRVQTGRSMGMSEAWTQTFLAGRAAAIQGALYPAIRLLVGPVPHGRAEILGAEARARLVKAPPPGAHWASSWGCGTTVEGVERNMKVGCGMGHVSAETARFLYFSDVSEWD